MLDWNKVLRASRWSWLQFDAGILRSHPANATNRRADRNITFKNAILRYRAGHIQHNNNCIIFLNLDFQQLISDTKIEKNERIGLTCEVATAGGDKLGNRHCSWTSVTASSQLWVAATGETDEEIELTMLCTAIISCVWRITSCSRSSRCLHQDEHRMHID